MKFNKKTGFTLIEVLIAMVVLAVGLLGLAGLQATSLKNNQSAYNRSQATQLAYDIADRMRANAAPDPASGTSMAPYGFAAKYLTTFMTPAAAIQANCNTVTSCTPTKIAENDLFEWNAAIGQALPGSAVGSITVVGDVYTVTINWDDNRDGVVDASDPSFQTSFQL
nr:type IV pilus modification protein PilV [methanotrophic endosymbiont of Bathymodiolus puteoserpentis (Logatchev)]